MQPLCSLHPAFLTHAGEYTEALALSSQESHSVLHLSLAEIFPLSFCVRDSPEKCMRKTHFKTVDFSKHRLRLDRHCALRQASSCMPFVGVSSIKTPRLFRPPRGALRRTPHVCPSTLRQQLIHRVRLGRHGALRRCASVSAFSEYVFEEILTIPAAASPEPNVP